MDGAPAKTRYEPDRWLICFKEKAAWPWVRWLAWGRFNHVSAFGMIPGANLWVFVEAGPGRLYVEALPDDAVGQARVAAETEGATVIVLARNFVDQKLRFRPWMSCVATVAHLVGIRSSALRPDAFYRDCLKAGGQVLELEADESAGTAEGS